jgi:hypothetical protein
LTVSKQAAQKFDREIFNLRKLNELTDNKHYKNEISNGFAIFKNLSVGKDINRAWENIKGNIKVSAKETLNQYELKQHKLWFDE